MPYITLSNVTEYWIQWIQWLRYNAGQTLYSQKTPHNSPSRASYGVSIASNLVNIDHVIMAPQCIKRLSSTQTIYYTVSPTEYALGSCSSLVLTHWGRDKMAAFSQTTLSNAFSWMKILEFWLKFHWSLFLRVLLTIFQHLFW